MDPMKRMFVVGLTVPAVVTAIVALTVGPDSLMQWLIVAATPFVASSAVAMAYAYRSRTRTTRKRCTM